jgi:hypothetical protein
MYYTTGSIIDTVDKNYKYRTLVVHLQVLDPELNMNEYRHW